jgi:signal peptidase I
MSDTIPPTLPAHAPEITNEPARPAEKKKTSALREVIETAILAILIFVTVRAVVLNFKVDGTSMLPTLQNGEMILVNRNAYRELDLADFVDWIPGVSEQNWFTLVDWGSPSRGDVVVFTPPEPGDQKPYIKRVIGLPGDRVQVTANHQVLVNGIALDEPYIGDYRNDCESVSNFPFCDVVVDEGHFFMMGDHRSNSQDSRFFSVVPEEQIIGKAWLVYWPMDNFGTVDHPDYPELKP